MAISSYISGVVSRIAATPPLTVPGIITKGYIKYLWNYEPESWVDRIASSFRVLSILVALPVVALGVLDIVSYGIARTLGIVGDVKASTNDKATRTHMTGEAPTIHISGGSTPGDSNLDRQLTEDIIQTRRSAVSRLLAASDPETFNASLSEV